MKFPPSLGCADQRAHESETHSIDADITIDNNGTQEDLATALAEHGFLDYH